MSGGVDSSVCAALLKNQGYQVIGVHMQLWDHGEANVERFGGRCCSLVDSNDARRVCDKLEIPYYVINAQDVFKEKVVDYFVHEYLEQRTPNPCAECNNAIKFNYLFQKADELGCDLVATGHYAQVFTDLMTGEAHLQKASDPQKDQTYFLFGLTQKALRRTLMPLGGLSKMMVRKLAEQFGWSWPTSRQPGDLLHRRGGLQAVHREPRRQVLPPRRPDPPAVGRGGGRARGPAPLHDRAAQGALAQGQGTRELLRLGYDRAGHRPDRRPEKDLFQKELMASKINWVRPVNELKGVRCMARIRSRHDEASCIVTAFENEQVHVLFEETQRAITQARPWSSTRATRSWAAVHRPHHHRLLSDGQGALPPQDAGVQSQPGGHPEARGRAPGRGWQPAGSGGRLTSASSTAARSPTRPICRAASWPRGSRARTPAQPSSSRAARPRSTRAPGAGEGSDLRGGQPGQARAGGPGAQAEAARAPRRGHLGRRG